MGLKGFQSRRKQRHPPQSNLKSAGQCLQGMNQSLINNTHTHTHPCPCLVTMTCACSCPHSREFAPIRTAPLPHNSETGSTLCEPPELQHERATLSDIPRSALSTPQNALRKLFLNPQIVSPRIPNILILETSNFEVIIEACFNDPFDCTDTGRYAKYGRMVEFCCFACVGIVRDFGAVRLPSVWGLQV